MQMFGDRLPLPLVAVLDGMRVERVWDLARSHPAQPPWRFSQDCGVPRVRLSHGRRWTTIHYQYMYNWVDAQFPGDPERGRKLLKSLGADFKPALKRL